MASIIAWVFTVAFSVCVVLNSLYSMYCYVCGEPPKKTLFCHFKRSNNKTEQLCTVAYQVCRESNTLKCGCVLFSKKHKTFLQKLIDELNPLSLDYLAEKGRLNKLMHNQRTWNRKEYCDKAETKLQKSPIFIPFPILHNEDLKAVDYTFITDYIKNNLERLL